MSNLEFTKKYYNIFADKRVESSKEKIIIFVMTLASVVGSAIIITFCYNWLFPIVYPLTMYRTLCLLMFLKMVVFIVLTGTPFVQQAIINVSGLNEYYYSSVEKHEWTIPTYFQVVRGAFLALGGLILFILYLFD